MFPPNSPLARRFVARPRRSGFSLVEVVLAVGIISFAFVAILGLLPAGLQQFRQAMDNSVASQIAQRVIMDAQQTDFDTLTGGSSTANEYIQVASYAATDMGKANPLYVRYFDEQGSEVVPQSYVISPAEQAKVVYFVNTRITTATSLPGVSSDTLSAKPNLCTILVQVAFNPSGQKIQTTGLTEFKFDPSAVKSRNIPVKNFTAQIGRNF